MSALDSAGGRTPQAELLSIFDQPDAEKARAEQAQAIWPRQQQHWEQQLANPIMAAVGCWSEAWADSEPR
jgi:hypothetical protein